MTAQSGPLERIDSIIDYWMAQPGVTWLVAIVIVLVGIYVSKLVVRLLGRHVARRFRRPSVTKTILRSIRMGIVVLAVALAAAVIGFRATDILLSVGVFSAVLGLVLAPIIGSIINGLFVLADQPYEIGDMIELVDREQRGFVEDITIRYTKVFTLDNTFLVIPNSTIRERDVINYSAEDERSRLSLPVLVTYEGDLERAQAILEEAAREVPEIIESGPDIRIGSARYPAEPIAYIDEFAADGVLLSLRFWVHSPYRIPSVRSKLQERIWDGMAEAEVQFAYPHRQLVFDEATGTPFDDTDDEDGQFMR